MMKFTQQCVIENTIAKAIGIDALDKILHCLVQLFLRGAVFQVENLSVNIGLALDEVIARYFHNGVNRFLTISFGMAA